MSTIRAGKAIRSGERLSRGNFVTWDEGYKFHQSRCQRLLGFVKDCEQVEARAELALQSAYQGDQDDADFRKAVKAFDKAHRNKMTAIDAYWAERAILKGIENGSIEP